MVALTGWPWLLIFTLALAAVCVSALIATGCFIWRVQRQVLRVIYDSLGEERSDVPCKVAGCKRGAARLSVFCKRHHFEKDLKSRCPA